MSSLTDLLRGSPPAEPAAEEQARQEEQAGQEEPAGQGEQAGQEGLAPELAADPGAADPGAADVTEPAEDTVKLGKRKRDEDLPEVEKMTTRELIKQGELLGLTGAEIDACEDDKPKLIAFVKEKQDKAIEAKVAVEKCVKNLVEQAMKVAEAEAAAAAAAEEKEAAAAAAAARPFDPEAAAAEAAAAAAEAAARPIDLRHLFGGFPRDSLDIELITILKKKVSSRGIRLGELDTEIEEHKTEKARQDKVIAGLNAELAGQTEINEESAVIAASQNAEIERLNGVIVTMKQEKKDMRQEFLTLRTSLVSFCDKQGELLGGWREKMLSMEIESEDEEGSGSVSVSDEENDDDSASGAKKSAAPPDGAKKSAAPPDGAKKSAAPPDGRPKGKEVVVCVKTGEDVVEDVAGEDDDIEVDDDDDDDETPTFDIDRYFAEQDERCKLHLAIDGSSFVDYKVDPDATVEQQVRFETTQETYEQNQIGHENIVLKNQNQKKDRPPQFMFQEVQTPGASTIPILISQDWKTEHKNVNTVDVTIAIICLSDDFLKSMKQPDKYNPPEIYKGDKYGEKNLHLGMVGYWTQKGFEEWDEPLNGLFSQEIEDGLILANNIFKGNLAMFFKTKDGNIMLGFDTELVRLLDDEDPTSGRHVKQRFHALLSDVVFLDYRDGSSVWIERNAMGLGLGCNTNLADNNSDWWTRRWALYPGSVIRNHSADAQPDRMKLGFIMKKTFEVCLGKGPGGFDNIDSVAQFVLRPEQDLVDRDVLFPFTEEVKVFAEHQARVIGNSYGLKVMLEAELVKRSKDRIDGYLADPDLEESIDAEMCFNGCVYMPLAKSTAGKIWKQQYEHNLMTQFEYQGSKEQYKVKFDFQSTLFIKFPTRLFIAMQRLNEVNECDCCAEKIKELGRDGPPAKKKKKEEKASGQNLILKPKKKK
jgi:hypothetical protein